MKSIVFDVFGGAKNLHIQEMPRPVPIDDEVLINVAYAGVNPVDWRIREGYLKDMFPHDFPIILGWDVAGTIVEIGKNVTNLQIGDEVFSYVRKPVVKWGAYAEYVAFAAKDVVKKPKNLTLKEAGALPLVSLTAWQSLFDAVHLKKGETILILEGSSGAGFMGIQFAKWVGASVLATGRSREHFYMTSFGADYVIDYRENVPVQVRTLIKNGVDVVFDCFGEEAFRRSLLCLKKGGRMVSLFERMGEEQAKILGITANYVFAKPSGENLTSIADLIEKGLIKPPHIEEMLLEDAGKAQKKVHSGNALGKIVLKVT